MSKIQRSLEKDIREDGELIENLDEQRQRLRRSIIAFEDGEIFEAVRIATAVHICVSADGSQTALLQQLKQRSKLFFPTPTRVPDGMQLIPSHYLVHTITSGNFADFTAVFNRGHYPIRHMKFQDWWSETIFETEGRKMSRKQLVCEMRNKEGGAHVSGEIFDEAFIKLAKEGTLFSLSETSPGKFQKGKTVLGVEKASIRQIGWEFEEAMKLLPSRFTNLSDEFRLPVVPPKPVFPEGQQVLTGMTFVLKPISTENDLDS